MFKISTKVTIYLLILLLTAGVFFPVRFVAAQNYYQEETPLQLLNLIKQKIQAIQLFIEKLAQELANDLQSAPGSSSRGLADVRSIALGTPVKLSSQATQIQNYNNQIIKLTKALKTKPSQKSTMQQLNTLVKRRKDILLNLIETRPQEAIKFVLPPELKGPLPAEALTNIEQEVTMEGTLETLHLDNFKSKTSKLSYFLKQTSGQRFALHFVVDPPQPLLTGTKVKVRGFGLDKKIILPSAVLGNLEIIAESRQTAIAQIATAVSERKVAVILFNFQPSALEPYTAQHAKGVVFTNSNSASAYYKEDSLGNLAIKGKYSDDGDVFGWYTIPFDGQGCRFFEWADAADAAATTNGVDMNGYDNIIYGFAGGDCGWAGVALLGGSRSWVTGMRPSLVSHEFGHNLGLMHANGYRCYKSSGGRVTLSNDCVIEEYGDPFDVMSIGTVWHMNNYHKGRASFFDSVNTQTVTASGIYTLAPIEKPSSATQSLRIPRDDKYLYLEFRQPHGFDSFNPSDHVVNGVSVRLAPDYLNFPSSLLLDANPSTSDFSDAALLAGQLFFDVDKGISVKTLSVEPEKATVEITFGSPPCQEHNPSLSISPTTQKGSAAKRQLSYTLNIRNDDSAGCSSSVFILTSSLPGGFLQTPDTLSITLAPSAAFSQQKIDITAPVDTQPAIYQFTETIAKSADLSSAASVTGYFDYKLNQPPVLDPIGNKTIKEGQRLNFDVSASDPDTDSLSITADILPPGASLVVNWTNSPSSAFRWTPTLAQTGRYRVTFSVTDGQISDSETIVISAYPLDFVAGDITDDKEVDGSDALVLLRYLRGLTTLSPKQLLIADVTQDNEATKLDAEVIQSYMALLVDKLPVLFGDTSGDGEVLGWDALLLGRHLKGLTNLNKNQLFVSDVYRDGKVDEADLKTLQEFLVGLVPALPVIP